MFSLQLDDSSLRNEPLELSMWCLAGRYVTICLQVLHETLFDVSSYKMAIVLHLRYVRQIERCGNLY